MTRSKDTKKKVCNTMVKRKSSQIKKMTSPKDKIKIKKEKKETPDVVSIEEDVNPVAANIVSPELKHDPKDYSIGCPKKINMDVEKDEDVIDLSQLDLVLKKKKKKESEASGSKDNPNGKLTLYIYKTKVVQVGDKKHKFVVFVDLVHSNTKKSLWCHDGEVVAEMFQSMATQFNFPIFEDAGAYEFRDMPGQPIRGNTSSSGRFYPFKAVLFPVTVDGTQEDVGEMIDKLVTNIKKIYSSPNFQASFIMVKQVMPFGIHQKFKISLEDSFKAGRNFALLQQHSFGIEVVNDAKIIDYFSHDTAKTFDFSDQSEEN